jgi:trans-2,3-dihydro-3-hydroxyanthranilate isomerase
MSPLRFELCDVFTDRPFAGNALAVFTDANGLDPLTMQALAREMNLSESTFVLHPRSDEADAQVRIFTPTMELPFAGHPTLGTALVLSRTLPGESTIRLETGSGIVPVRIAAFEGRARFGRMQQPIPNREAFATTQELLTALRISAPILPIQLYDNGPRCVLIELETPAEIAALSPDLARLASFGRYAFVLFARKYSSWKVRVFAPGGGVPEDPATGAAAGPLAVHLASQGRISFGDEVVIEQGAEVGRPSTLYARAFGSAERIERVEVGGNGVVVATGEFDRSLL